MSNFNCEVKVVDELMGSGKTSAAINLINSSDEDERFLFITPYLSEVERIKTSCSSKKFKEPCFVRGRKLEGIKELINRGENIVSTHSLFQKFDLEVIDLCRAQNYSLIMDEVTNVVEKYDISKRDFELLQEFFVDIDEETGLLKWRNSDDNYRGKFSEEKRLCELNSLAYYGGSVMMWLFPIEVFNAFRNIYILTYMFDAQIQRYYYDYYHLPYKYMYITGNLPETYRFTEDISERTVPFHDFKRLIHIVEDEKINRIGDTEFDLSKTWYDRNKNNFLMKQMKNNILNFFTHKAGTKTSQNLWTTFKDYKKALSGKGYGRGFAPLNMRASNDYADRISVAYPVNRYIDPGIKHFFMKHGVEVNEGGFALSEMLQFIWRSAIRQDKEITVYVPSVRMRMLLKDWIESQDVDGDANTNTDTTTPNDDDFIDNDSIGSSGNEEGKDKLENDRKDDEN